MKFTRSTAEISACGRYRFVLSREWEQGEGRVCWVMLNPSTADATKPDHTLTKCVEFSRRWGFKALDIVNLFPLRTKSPRVLKASTEIIGPRDEHERLLTDVFMLATVSIARLVVCAWGRHGTFLQRDRVVVEQLRAFPLMCLGTNVDGTPRHPLMLPYEMSLVPFARPAEVSHAA